MATISAYLSRDICAVYVLSLLSLLIHCQSQLIHRYLAFARDFSPSFEIPAVDQDELYKALLKWFFHTPPPNPNTTTSSDPNTEGPGFRLVTTLLGIIDQEFTNRTGLDSCGAALQSGEVTQLFACIRDRVDDVLLCNDKFFISLLPSRQDSAQLGPVAELLLDELSNWVFRRAFRTAWSELVRDLLVFAQTQMLAPLAHNAPKVMQLLPTLRSFFVEHFPSQSPQLDESIEVLLYRENSLIGLINSSPHVSDLLSCVLLDQ